MRNLSLLSFLIFFIDQVIKYKISHQFLPGEGFSVIKKIFRIRLVHNPGIAFGLFPNIPLFILIIGLILFLPFLFKKNKDSRMESLAKSLIIGGASSNLFDRLRFGYVIDYLDFYIWPVFNLGDVAITVGIGLLLWGVLRKSKDF